MAVGGITHAIGRATSSITNAAKSVPKAEPVKPLPDEVLERVAGGAKDPEWRPGISRSCTYQSEVCNILNKRYELTGSTRDQLLATVQDTELGKIVNELYRPGALVGDGGTAAILVEEFNRGISTHLVKAVERVKQLKNLISSKKLGLNDLDIAEALISDLNYAISLFS